MITKEALINPKTPVQAITFLLSNSQVINLEIKIVLMMNPLKNINRIVISILKLVIFSKIDSNVSYQPKAINIAVPLTPGIIVVKDSIIPIKKYIKLHNYTYKKIKNFRRINSRAIKNREKKKST